jgi:hypothetical protein
MRSIANCTRLALIAVSSCALATGSLAHADTPPQDTVIPQGWVWQGVWQDGRWSGQWMPGPGAMAPGGYAPPPSGAYAPPPPPGPMPWAGNPGPRRMADHCGDARHDADEHPDHHRHRHDCDAVIPDHGGYAPAPYPAMPYPAMPYPAAGFVMVPVITQPQPAPCVETRTVTTEYVVERRSRVIHTKVIRAAPHRKEKRVYTGS